MTVDWVTWHLAANWGLDCNEPQKHTVVMEKVGIHILHAVPQVKDTPGRGVSGYDTGYSKARIRTCDVKRRACGKRGNLMMIQKSITKNDGNIPKAKMANFTISPKTWISRILRQKKHFWQENIFVIPSKQLKCAGVSQALWQVSLKY